MAEVELRAVTKNFGKVAVCRDVDRLAQPVGPATFVTLSWDGGELTARVPGMATFAAGAAVHFRVDREDHLMFFEDHQGRRMAME